MPLLLLVLIVVALWMFMTFKARQHTRNCRWRENRSKDTPDGRFFTCINCGVETFSESGLPPAICLKPDAKG